MNSPPLLLSVVVATTIVAGCGSRVEPDESFDQMRNRLMAEIEQEYANRVSAVCQEARTKLPASSVEDLLEAFTLAFNAGDTDALKSMVHMENVPEDENLEDIAINGVVGTRSSGTSTIQVSQGRTPVEEDLKPWWSLEPVFLFEYTSRSNDDSGSSTRRAPIVKVDEHYFFYACGRPVQ